MGPKRRDCVWVVAVELVALVAVRTLRRYLAQLGKINVYKGTLLVINRYCESLVMEDSIFPSQEVNDLNIVFNIGSLCFDYFDLLHFSSANVNSPNFRKISLDEIDYEINNEIDFTIKHCKYYDLTVKFFPYCLTTLMIQMQNLTITFFCISPNQASCLKYCLHVKKMYIRI